MNACLESVLRLSYEPRVNEINKRRTRRTRAAWPLETRHRRSSAILVKGRNDVGVFAFLNADFYYVDLIVVARVVRRSGR